MAVQFTDSQWEKLNAIYDLWWKNELDRPIFQAVLTGVDPKRTQPNAPLLTQRTCLDFSISAEQIIERIDYELSCKKYIGDAFPFFNMDCFGPGVLSAFLGADVSNDTGNIWMSAKEKELSELSFSFDPNNKYFRRIKDIYRAGMKRWGSNVVMGMVDLGGILDILAVFRGTENLLMDLFDQGDEIKRLNSQLHDIWFLYFDEINSILSPYCAGYSDWSKILSSKPSYVIQSDFSYMISTDMFVEFVKDEISVESKRLSNCIYHLDGKGQLNHLDELLSIESINAIQWVPGDGAPRQAEWPEVFEKISAAGKGMQLWGNFEELDIVKDIIGSYKGLLNWVNEYPIEDEKEVRRNLERLGIY